MGGALEQGEELVNSSAWAHRAMHASSCFCAQAKEVPSPRGHLSQLHLQRFSARSVGLDWAGAGIPHTRVYEFGPEVGPEVQVF